MTHLLLLLALAAAPATPATGGARSPAADDAKATKDDYELDTTGSDSKLKAGADGKFSLVLRPKNGKKVHPEAPLEVLFKDPKGVKTGKPKLGRNDVVDKAAKAPEVQTTMRGDKAGSYTVDASVSFFICSDTWCQRMTDRVSIPVTIE